MNEGGHVAGPGANQSRVNWRLLSLSIVVVGGLVVIAANAHLVYVAVLSQPECVAHTKSGSEDGTLRAASPSC